MATDVLAHVIECATGCDLGTLLQAEIFVLLEMRNTAFHLAEKDQSRLMAMYGPGDLAGLPPLSALPHVLVRRNVSGMYPTVKPDFCRGGLGLYATLADYMGFGRFLLTGRGPDGDKILAPKTHALLMQSRITVD